jgi:hypothetical protein
MRKRTGLRNRGRSGRSTYSVQNKSRRADRYGTYYGRRCESPDTIAGHTLHATKEAAYA